MLLSPEQLDLVFIEAEQQVTKGLLSKRILVENAYLGHIPDGENFPLGSGLSIKGNRLGRVTVPTVGGWRPLEDSVCETNLCSTEREVISHGNSDYFYSAVQRDLRTDWICLDSLSVRANAMEEIAHLEEGLKDAARYVHEEFRRSRYIAFCGNKLMAKVERTSEEVDTPVADFKSCDDLINQAFVFELLENGQIDEMHVRVCIKPTEVDLISELTLDMLDYAPSRLQYDNPQAKSVGGVLFDVLTADDRMKSRMALQENEILNYSASYGGYNMFDLAQTYGTTGVLRNFSLRPDLHAMRFYVDTAFNTANSITDGNFDEDDPNTWTRFVRVVVYKNVKSKGNGVEAAKNTAFERAPFGITTIMTPRVMSVQGWNNWKGTGSAQKAEDFGYDGSAKWKNPDWPENDDRDKGFWKLRFRLAAKPQFTEEGYCFFHRIDRRNRLRGNVCAVPAAPTCTDAATPYCYSGIIGNETNDKGLGANAAIDN